jgi:hypothetical protein
MPELFTLTPDPVRVTATGMQPMVNALDISRFDQIEAVLGVTSIDGGSVTIKLWTGMQIDTENGWKEIAAYSSTSSPDSWEKQVVAPIAGSGGTVLLRYLRWEVASISASSATFVLNGIGRSFT